MRTTLRVALPLLILAAGGVGAWVLLATAPKIEEKRPERVAPLIRVVEVEPQALQLRVHTTGTVSPRTESDLVPQVSGSVVWVSPSLTSGGFFDHGDVLLRIEPYDYEAALERARANLARAQSEHHRAKKELKRLRGLARTGVASESQLDDAERGERVGAATLREAEAMLGQAERDLQRTEIKAPFSGRVRDENVDVGQFVNRGAPIARIYAIDYAEVRLPIADDELAFIDLPLWRSGDEGERDGPEVVLRARFAGGDHEWTGRVVRTEGAIDARSRMINVVARVHDPYGREQANGSTPLAVGLFVEAEILGKTLSNVILAPRAAVRDRDSMVVVDHRDLLRIRRVDVIRRGRRRVVIPADALEPGDRVVLSSLETAVDGMEVRPIVDEDGMLGEGRAGL
jgi:RND family efflux transporter MFP subunit